MLAASSVLQNIKLCSFLSTSFLMKTLSSQPKWEFYLDAALVPDVFTGKYWKHESHLKIFRKLSGSSLETSVNPCTSQVSSAFVRLHPVSGQVPQILCVS